MSELPDFARYFTVLSSRGQSMQTVWEQKAYMKGKELKKSKHYLQSMYEERRYVYNFYESPKYEADVY